MIHCIEYKFKFVKQISKSLAIFEKLTPGHHIVRPGRVRQLAAPRAGIPLAHRYRRALRCTCSTPRRNSYSSSMPKSSTRSGLPFPLEHFRARVTVSS
eukprot:9449748-Pyramimonas_sp.AAC.1